MPANPEQLLISSVLRVQDMPTALAHGVSEQMFHAYPEEWEWIANYFNKYKKTPSRVAFKKQFPDFSILATNDTGHFSDEVRKTHARHELMSVIRDVTDLIADNDVESAVKKVHASVIGIAAGMSAHTDLNMLDNWEETYSEVKNRMDRVAEGGMAGVPTGFERIDAMTGGPQPGDLWIVGARLGHGKTWTMLKMAATAIAHGHTVQFNSLEQSRTQISMRLSSLLASPDGKDLYKTADLMQGRDFSITGYRKFLSGLRKNISGSIFITDTGRGKVSPLTVAAQIERNNPAIVFIDYITLMEMKGERDWKSVAAISGELKSIAMSYQVPIVAAAQLNRTMGLSKSEPAGPEALAQSDAIGQDADAVVTLQQTSRSTLVGKMAKYRHGPAGFKFFCHFDPGAGIFKDVTQDKYLDLKDKDHDTEDADRLPKKRTDAKTPASRAPVRARVRRRA